MKLTPRTLLFLVGMPAGYLPLLVAVWPRPVEVGVTGFLLTAFSFLEAFRAERAADEPRQHRVTRCVTKFCYVYACCVFVGTVVAVASEFSPFPYHGPIRPPFRLIERFFAFAVLASLSLMTALWSRRSITSTESGLTDRTTDQPVARQRQPFQFTIATMLAVTAIFAIWLNLWLGLGLYSSRNLALYAKREKQRAIEDSTRQFEKNHGPGSAWRAELERQAMQRSAHDADLRRRQRVSHINMGNEMVDMGRRDEAIAWYRKAIVIDPGYALGHTSLGNALLAKGQVDEAIASFRKAIELAPEFAPYRTVLAQAERLAAARDKLADFQNGSYIPASNQERHSLAEWCEMTKLHHTAAGLYADIFEADPTMADDLGAAHHYTAVRAAALAAAGKGDDAANLDDAARAKLRSQAFDWLKAEVTTWGEHLESGPSQDRATIVETLKRWQSDTDLASIRDAAELAKLPAVEQKAFTELWADVAELLLKAEENPE